MCSLSTPEHSCTNCATLECIVHLLREFNDRVRPENLADWFERHACALAHQENTTDEFDRIVRIMQLKPRDGEFAGNYVHFSTFHLALFPIDRHGLKFSSSILINPIILWKDIVSGLRLAPCPRGTHPDHIVFRCLESGDFWINNSFVKGQLIRDIIGCDGKIIECTEFL